MTQAATKTARRTKASTRKGADMTQTAKTTRKPAAKKVTAPAAMPEEASVATKAYAAFVGRKQLEGQTEFTMKEARKLLWREAKRLGLTDTATPREFFAGAIKGGGNWEVKVGKKSFVIKEFLTSEVAA